MYLIVKLYKREIVNVREVGLVEDKKLMRQIQQGNSHALDILIRKYYNDIYSYCFRRTTNATVAADLTQEVFLKLAKYIHNYVHKGKFRNYLFIIARNICNDYYTKRGTVVEDIDLLDIPDRDSNFSRLEQSEIILKALDSLPDIQKDVIILRFYHDMKVKEISEITGASIATTKSRLKQGLDKLKKILRKGDVF